MASRIEKAPAPSTSRAVEKRAVPAQYLSAVGRQELGRLAAEFHMQMPHKDTNAEWTLTHLPQMSTDVDMQDAPTVDLSGFMAEVARTVKAINSYNTAVGELQISEVQARIGGLSQEARITAENLIELHHKFQEHRGQVHLQQQAIDHVREAAAILQEEMQVRQALMQRKDDELMGKLDIVRQQNELLNQQQVHLNEQHKEVQKENLQLHRQHQEQQQATQVVHMRLDAQEHQQKLHSQQLEELLKGQESLLAAL